MDPPNSKKQRFNKKHNKKQKKNRSNNKKVNIEDTNKYKHWEARALILGFMVRYCPQAKIDLDKLIQQNGTEMGMKIFMDSFKGSGMCYFPYKEPELLDK